MEDDWEEPKLAESERTETDISGRSEKAPRVSLWIADVARAIREHGEGLGRRMEERSQVAARASIMMLVIRAGGSVETYQSWVKELERGDTEEEENPGKGKKREWGKNPLNDLLEVNTAK